MIVKRQQTGVVGTFLVRLDGKPDHVDARPFHAGFLERRDFLVLLVGGVAGRPAVKIAARTEMRKGVARRTLVGNGRNLERVKKDTRVSAGTVPLAFDQKFACGAG